MSDGLSDAANAEREARVFSQYLMALATHLTVKTQDSLEKLKAACPYEEEKKLEGLLSRLTSNMKSDWAKFLLYCQDNNLQAFDRCRHLAPFPKDHIIQGIRFDRWSELSSFFRPYFRAAGLATAEGNGDLDGYDMYALVFTPEMSLKQIAQEAVWIGFKVTGWTPGVESVVPTSPLRKDRVKKQ